MKKSFILHIDSLSVLDELTDEQAGQLFKKIYDYHNPKEPKKTEITQLVSLVFIPFKLQFDRDLQSYSNVVERNIKNGSKGGRPKKGNPKKPKKPDSDSKNDNVNDKIDFSLFWNLYPRKEEKKTAATKWNKLPKEKQEKILQTLPAFLKGKDVKFIPMPVTYFNNERWDDELTIEPVMTEEERKAEITRNFLSRL